ncbi:ribonuclease E activity regulator RraA [Rhizobium laguerreae]
MKTADLVDAFGDDVLFCDLPFIKLGRKTSFSGEIVTVKCFEDNALLKAELQKPGQGKVMVVDGGGSTRFALLGDQIALILKNNDWSGIVINGSVRDSAEIDDMDVAVYCRSVTPKKSGKDGVGETSIPVSFGGVTFRPGEHVYADSDGVLVSVNRLDGNAR